MVLGGPRGSDRPAPHGGHPMATTRSPRSPSEVAAIQARLQELADHPGRVERMHGRHELDGLLGLPLDSRRSTEPAPTSPSSPRLPRRSTCAFSTTLARSAGYGSRRSTPSLGTPICQASDRASVTATASTGGMTSKKGSAAIRTSCCSTLTRAPSKGRSTGTRPATATTCGIQPQSTSKTVRRTSSNQ